MVFRLLLWNLFFFVTSISAQQFAVLQMPKKRDMVYTIELLKTPFTMVKISVLVPAANAKHSDFSIQKSWGGVTNCWDEVHGAKIVDSTGKTLKIERPKPHIWRIKNRPKETLLLSYFLVPARYVVSKSNPYRPIIARQLVHLIGETAFLIPDHLNDNKQKTIELRWQNFMSEGWKTASSFGLNQDRVSFHSTLEEFRHAVYIAAPNLKLYTSTIKKHPIAMAFTEGWKFTDNQFVSMATKIIEYQRAFFNDFAFPYFLITAIPVGKEDPRSVSIGGTGLTNSFALFLQRGTGLKKNLIHLLAHEHFHTWNGRVIQRKDPEQLVYWFSEGFTDYFTRRILYRTKLFTAQDYIAIVNSTIKKYFTSPVRYEPNIRIKKDFWNEYSVEKLPYLRGAIIAMLCDHEIRMLSKGQKSLDTFIKEIVHLARTKNIKISTPMLLETIERFTSKKFAGIIGGIIEGKDIPGVPATIEPDLKVKIKNVACYNFDLGFDFATSRKKKIVVKVRPNGPAFKAGLRDGQKLRGWSVHGRKADKKAEFSVVQNRKKVRIAFFPRGTAFQVPQYMLQKE